jgi:hypothetical protein
MPTLPFSRGSTDPAPEPETSSDASPTRRLVLVAGVVTLAVSVMLLLVPRLLSGGSSDRPVTPVGALSRAPSPSSPTPSASVEPPPDFSNVTVRNPFETRYDAAAPTADKGVTPVPTSQPTHQPPSQRTHQPTYQPPQPAPSSTSRPGGHTSISMRGAPSPDGQTYQVRFRVDGSRLYTVRVGDTFAGTLRLRSVQSDANGVLSATVRYGTRTPFDIRPNQTVTLRG